MSCDQCGTSTCHRTNVNPYCSATVRIRCDYCGKIRTVNGLPLCEGRPVLQEGKVTP